MTDKLLFPAVKLEGDRLMFRDQDKVMIKQWFARGKAPYALVEFRRPRRPRSTGKDSQSHRINGFLAQICAATGDDFDRLKVELKQRAISRGWPFVTVQWMTAGGVMVEAAIAKSESLASVEEASILIGVVEHDAAQKGVVLVE